MWKYIILGIMEGARPTAASIWRSALRRYCERALAIQHVARMKVQEAESRGRELQPRELEQYAKWIRPLGDIGSAGNIHWTEKTLAELKERELHSYIQNNKDPPPKEPPPKTPPPGIQFVSAGFQTP